MGGKKLKLVHRKAPLCFLFSNSMIKKRRISSPLNGKKVDNKKERQWLPFPTIVMEDFCMQKIDVVEGASHGDKIIYSSDAADDSLCAREKMMKKEKSPDPFTGLCDILEEQNLESINGKDYFHGDKLKNDGSANENDIGFARMLQTPVVQNDSLIGQEKKDLVVGESCPKSECGRIEDPISLGSLTGVPSMHSVVMKNMEKLRQMVLKSGDAPLQKKMLQAPSEFERRQKLRRMVEDEFERKRIMKLRAKQRKREEMGAVFLLYIHNRKTFGDSKLENPLARLPAQDMDRKHPSVIPSWTKADLKSRLPFAIRDNGWRSQVKASICLI